MEKLKELRLEKELTQTDVAKICGVSLSSYRLWECGVTKPNDENRKKLNQLFNFDE